MAQKKRISDEAFPWVKNTSKGVKPEVKDGSKKKNVSAANKVVKTTIVPASTASAMKRTTTLKEVDTASVAETVFEPSTQTPRDQIFKRDTVFVLYDLKGSILSVAQIDRKYLPASGMPFVTNNGTQAAELGIPGELASKGIADIHASCIVRGLDTKPYLELKK